MHVLSLEQMGSDPCFLVKQKPQKIKQATEWLECTILYFSTNCIFKIMTVSLIFSVLKHFKTTAQKYMDKEKLKQLKLKYAA